jgi:chromosomal replication initiation ATPase DnaA
VSWAVELIATDPYVGEAELQRVVELVTRAFGVPQNLVFDKERAWPAAIQARKIVAYVIRRRYHVSYPNIARWLRRDYTTARGNCLQVAERCRRDPHYAGAVYRLLLEVG